MITRGFVTNTILTRGLTTTIPEFIKREVIRLKSYLGYIRTLVKSFITLLINNDSDVKDVISIEKVKYNMRQDIACDSDVRINSVTRKSYIKRDVNDNHNY